MQLMNVVLFKCRVFKEALNKEVINLITTTHMTPETLQRKNYGNI